MAIKVQLAAPPKVYYHWVRRLMWLVSGMVLLVALWMIANGSSWFGPAMLLFQSTILFWTTHTLRLVISPAGIAFDHLGLYSVVTAWSNVERVAEIPSRSGGTFRALLLREPAAIGWPHADAALLPEHRGRAIPLSGLSWMQPRLWGRVNELEQDIQHYAPHALP